MRAGRAGSRSERPTQLAVAASLRVPAKVDGEFSARDTGLAAIAGRAIAERCRRVTLGFALGKLTLQIGYELLGIG